MRTCIAHFGYEIGWASWYGFCVCGKTDFGRVAINTLVIVSMDVSNPDRLSSKEKWTYHLIKEFVCIAVYPSVPCVC